MFCRNFGKEVDDKAVVCIHCGAATGVPMPVGYSSSGDDKADNVLMGLSFLVPLIGVILAVVNYNKGFRVSGEAYLKCALYPILVLLIVFLVGFLFSTFA